MRVYTPRKKQIQVEFHQGLLDLIEAFRGSQPIKPTMADTIRGLCELGLHQVTAERKRMAAKDKAAA